MDYNTPYLMHPHRLLSLLLLLALLTACAPAQPADLADSSRPWQYADLRLAEPAGGRPPAQDIVAAYARRSGADVEIRVDLLQSKSNADFDFYLAVDTRPGGETALPLDGQADLGWETWISFSTGRASSAVQAGGTPLSALTPRLYRDLDLDAAVVRLNWKDLGASPARLAFQVFLTPPGSLTVLDQTPVFHLDGPSPQRALLLLAFWNSLPAQTPAQALRRWNGAHTGPQGHRHGLAQILQAVQATRVPVTLLDLKTPDSLAGLEQVSGLVLVRELAARGLLLLPDAAAGDPDAARTALELSRAAAARFGLPASPAAYAAFRDAVPGRYRLVFRRGEDPTPVQKAGAARIIHLPADQPALQPDAHGLSLDARRLLLAQAAASSPGLTVLGGDLPQSLWGDADVAGAAFRYISGHPWIQPLGADALLTLPAARAQALPIPAGCQNLLCSPAASSPAEETLRAQLRTELEKLPAGNLRDAAWLMYLRLTQPVDDPQRAQLQAVYLGQVGYLLRAAGWLRAPTALNDCSQDVDFDGQPECLLASPTRFAVLELRGARLALLVSAGPGGGQEWVGPSAQFAVGLGVPDEWKPGLGEASDPRVIPGGLADQPDAFRSYTAATIEQGIRFTGPDGQVKIYRLAGGQLEVEYEGGPVTTRLPLVLGAGAPRTPGWGYRYFFDLSQDQTRFRWWSGEQNGVSVAVSAARLKITNPLDSFDLMRAPEDPDRDYPHGHFLPYPIIQVEIQSGGPFTLAIGSD